MPCKSRFLHASVLALRSRSSSASRYPDTSIWECFLINLYGCCIYMVTGTKQNSCRQQCACQKPFYVSHIYHPLFHLGSVKRLPLFCSKTFILGSLQTKRAIPPIFWYNVNRQTNKTRNEVIAHGHYTLFIKLHQLPTQNYWSVIEFYLQIHPTKAVGF